MKNLKKLKIISENKLKNEELLILKGGGDRWYCFCYGGNMCMTNYGIMGADSVTECMDSCNRSGFPCWTWNNIWP
jgi:hypothetical protein